MNSARLIASMIVAGVIAMVLTAVATKLVAFPEHDEFAYMGNALYWSGLHSASGMTFNGETYLVTFTERPPLFWWFLTGLFTIGMSPYVAMIISPLFTALNAMLVTLFAYELTRDVKSGIFAGVLTAVSGFAISVGSHVLSDAMGSFFAVLAMYAFYQYVFKQRRIFALILGLSIGLGLVARDEDLVTLILLIVLWILFVPKAGLVRKFVYLAVLGLVFGIPVLKLGMAGTLQLISNLATPIVFDFWPIILIAGAFAAFFGYRSKKRMLFMELGGAFFAFFLVMLPFFFDNYTLGNVDYYIAGKGILARPVAHLLMIPQTGGAGYGLSTSARIFDWITSIPQLLSIPVLICAALGIYFLARYERKNFVFLLLWTLATLGFVVGATNIEDRFLLIAFAPIMIFAGIGLGYLWKKDYLLGGALAVASFILSDLIPRAPISLSNLTVVASLTATTQNWLYSFLPTITLNSPKALLSPALLAEGLLALPFAIIVIAMGAYLGFSNALIFNPVYASKKAKPESDNPTIVAPKNSKVQNSSTEPEEAPPPLPEGIEILEDRKIPTSSPPPEGSFENSGGEGYSNAEAKPRRNAGPTIRTSDHGSYGNDDDGELDWLFGKSTSELDTQQGSDELSESSEK